MRIAHYLARSGLGARRKTEAFVRNGDVIVNNQTVTDLSFEINENDIVKYRGKEIRPVPLVYYLLYKPLGYTCSLSDVHAKNLITELVPADPPVWPIGRLDRDTQGLILLTNDGDLTFRLTHPKHEVEKEYEVTLERYPDSQEFKILKRGAELEDGFFKPDSLTKVADKYLIVIHSGKKRIIRRYFKENGFMVKNLKRIRIGEIRLTEIKSGKWRALKKEEREYLNV